MAFLHCHNCGWSQDDFWSFKFGKWGYFTLIEFGNIRISWKYNPISCFLTHLFGKYGYLKPRRIKFDHNVMDESGWKRIDPHSWWLIWYEFKRMIVRFKKQTWWTYESFKKDRNKYSKYEWPPCPKCGKQELDID